MRGAVLFDMDGVLVDSFEPHRRSWLALAAEEGLPFDVEQFRRDFGKTGPEVIASWWPGRASDAERLAERKEALYRADIERDFPPGDGAAELVRALHDAGFRIALASSAPPDNAEMVLDRLGVRDCFDALTTSDDVERGKPDPTVFVKAAAKVGVPPQRCLVIEDAPVGVAAAHRGGMAALVVLSAGHRPEDYDTVRPERMVRSLREVTPRLVEETIAARG